MRQQKISDAWKSDADMHEELEKDETTSIRIHWHRLRKLRTCKWGWYRHRKERRPSESLAQGRGKVHGRKRSQSGKENGNVGDKGNWAGVEEQGGKMGGETSPKILQGSNHGHVLQSQLIGCWNQ